MTSIIIGIMTTLVKALPTDFAKSYVQRGINWCGTYVMNTENEVDDAIFLPMLDAANHVLEVTGDIELSLMYLGQVISEFGSELSRRYIEDTLNWAEEEILESKSKVDDLLILPLVTILRRTLT